ncbi:uncharacterized protein MONBRDRAFT_16434 [Monosiga brevicollis MX1]|uniref:Aminotransferase class I/classII large domain-containing protein n=1 Tax=Monosiga brevicollis TaxID=81824 RepID=A9UWW3_MONBE|nr:uncharacterized protein MONBRDRAFT_16434 [Monosiga brevicollis MX1]EDQ90285.1 predicted protein [Monosiga brevicollis MX1]|eukprot:XP_001745052.1 hypothetical protein [Monosiga brevicollis MX1]
MAQSPVLHADGRINANVLAATYAVRGKIYEMAMQRKAEGKKVILTNVGNPHSLGQPAITFPRQVLALMNYPALLDAPNVGDLFPADVIARARTYLEAFPGGTGAYQDSRGNPAIRKEVADFISARDGHPASPDDIFLSDGASPAIQNCLKMLIRDKQDAVLLPIPQYPLYSAACVALGGTVLGYELDEDNNWALDMNSLQQAIDDAKRRGLTIRGMVIINPGNPTGQVLPRDNMEAVVRWCIKQRVVLFADEVYQTNIYGDRPFISFRKVIKELGADAQGIECFSFHTVSKGVFGECGRRGGYVELLGIHPSAREQLYKLFSINLSSNVDGQLMVGLMCSPPRPGDASYPTFTTECDAIFQSLKRRAAMVTEAFNRLPFISCRNVEGALYAFPQIQLSKRACAEAEKRGVAADVLYCMELLDETGICAVPGSGFGQRDGTFHFRTTILPPEEQFESILQLFADFHLKFMDRYGRPAEAKM